MKTDYGTSKTIAEIKAKEKFTPGPWRVERRDEGDYVYAGEMRICYPLGGCDLDSGESANARLIAAAPDMLNELEQRSLSLGTVRMLLLQKDIVGALDELDRIADYEFSNGEPKARSAAIAKARGEQ